MPRAIPATPSRRPEAVARIWLCIGLFLAHCAAGWAAAAAAPIVLPVEVVGADGTTVTVSVDSVPGALAPGICGLCLRVHGLGFDGMASVRVNGEAWVPLSNATADVSEPGRSYGGIGGGFATLDLRVPVRPGAVTPRGNRIAFRFNHTEGVASGYRVLAFNFVAADGSEVLPASTFAQDDPDSWRPPVDGEAARAEGERLWSRAPLLANGLPGAPPIRARCADCHAQNGEDLKYFSFSNASIVARSRFHGLTETEGLEIASYIRSLAGPNPGRPWNPPFQPGPGLSEKPAEDWSAGAGLEQVAADEASTLRRIFGTSESGALKITPGAFRPDGDLDPRDIPISMQLPDWNHWLPRVHPLDAWNADFAQSGAMGAYEALKRRLASPQAGASRGLGPIQEEDFADWVRKRNEFLKPVLPADAAEWTPELANKAYSTQLWLLVKTWELEHEFGPESRPAGALAGADPVRAWKNAVPSATSPAALNIPDGPAGMGGSGLVNEYFDNAWYEVQILVDGSEHGREPSLRPDWIYIIGRYLDLQRYSRRAEPGRVTVAIIKALQATDPRLGPELTNGWRPSHNLDPRIFVAKEWTETFEALPAETRRELAESFLQAWLEKNRQYPAVRYFARFAAEDTYVPQGDAADFAGGRAWEGISRFADAGVPASLLRKLQNWGEAYSDMAERFHY